MICMDIIIIEIMADGPYNNAYHWTNISNENGKPKKKIADIAIPVNYQANVCRTDSIISSYESIWLLKC